MDSPPPDLLSWAFWVQNSATVRDLLLALTAPVALITAGAALRQASIAAKRHTAQTSADQARLITDSFTKAVEMLGSDKLEARFGGIYTLQDIARENKRLHWPIMETLAAYVRTKPPEEAIFRSTQRQLPDKTPSAYTVSIIEGTADAAQRTVQNLPSELAADIQAVLTLLAKRTTAHENDDQCINLSGGYLSRADLRGANLRGANLSRANLSRANLTGADLTDANLSEVNLSRADLTRANLSSVYLSGANLSQANLTATNLTNAELLRTNLRKAFMIGANLKEAVLDGANLTEACLLAANLNRANLSEANLTEADLSRANLEDVWFCKTIMPDGTVNNRDCPPEPAPPTPSETPPASN